ncbi:AMP-dependent synthetase [Veillonella denticariosi JCM 15641]|uniref:AMP-dependent synthetase n=1 Tax=Veillonella denticariosi JCM 15641 TaxID=1298594 RepID=A0A2S7Z6E3_9FIRM|nr:AMP-binding protein [Veillonella denticariosi]PQL18878.1 AMP-dependent synthetase [Veillonella denticariosi JCM 15641]
MNIIERLKSHRQLNPKSIALTVDERQYTYEDLWADITGIQFELSCMMTEAQGGRKIILIRDISFYNQCILWFGALYRGYIPMVCHNEMNDDYIEKIKDVIKTEGIPPQADFGVLTSGTTGNPKPLWRNESSWRDFFDVQNGVFHINSRTILFLQGSFSFTGVSNMTVAVLWAGGTVLTSQSLKPTKWIQLMEAHRADHIYALPTKLRLLMRHCECTLSSVDYIIAGSQVLDRDLMERLEFICPRMQFILYYGASELNYISYCSGSEWLEREHTVGKAFPSVQVEEQDGLLYITTAYHIEGIPDTYTVNDCGYIDSDGYIIFTGRQGDVVNKGGYKISVPSMERYLQSLTGVDEVAVIVIDDDMRGEDFAVFMVLAEGSSRADVFNRIRESLPSVEWPKKILDVPMLPLTECSKVDKRKLKEWYNKLVCS